MTDIFGTKKQTIKKSDLNKKVILANNKYKAKNKILDKNIKNKESEIKSLDKEIKSLNNEIKSLIETVSNNKTLLSKENIKLHDISNDIKDRDIKDRITSIYSHREEPLTQHYMAKGDNVFETEETEEKDNAKEKEEE